MQPFSRDAEGDCFSQHVRRPANRPDSSYAFPPPTPNATGSYGERRHSRSHTTPSTLQLAATTSTHQQSWSLQPFPHTALEPSFALTPHFYSAPASVQPALSQSAHAAAFFEASYPRRGERPCRSVSHNPPTFLSFPTLTAAYIPRDVPSLPEHDDSVEQYTPLAPHLPVNLLPPAAPRLPCGSSEAFPFPREHVPSSQHLAASRQTPGQADYASVGSSTSDPGADDLDSEATAIFASASATQEPFFRSRSELEQPASSVAPMSIAPASGSPAEEAVAQGRVATGAKNVSPPNESNAVPSSQERASAGRACTRATDLPLIVESAVADKTASPGRKRSRRTRMPGVFHPPPQSMLRPGVIIPSAGAIAAPLGRGKALFPGTSSSSRPSAEDFAKMPLQKRKIRGRKALVLADLDLTLDDVNDPYSPATDAQIAFTGLTRSGAPRKLQCCKVPGCEQVFKRSEHLKRHVRSIHTVEKPFQCQWPTCKQYFGRHDNLYQHLRVHRTANETHAEFSAKLEAYFGARLDEVKLEQAQFLDDLQETERQLAVEALTPPAADEVGDQAADSHQQSEPEAELQPRRRSFRLPNPFMTSGDPAGLPKQTAPPAAQPAEPISPIDGSRETAAPRRRSSRRKVPSRRVGRTDSEEVTYEPTEPVAQAWRAATGRPMYTESAVDDVAMG